LGGKDLLFFFFFAEEPAAEIPFTLGWLKKGILNCVLVDGRILYTLCSSGSEVRMKAICYPLVLLPCINYTKAGKCEPVEDLNQLAGSTSHSFYSFWGPRCSILTIIEPQGAPKSSKVQANTPANSDAQPLEPKTHFCPLAKQTLASNQMAKSLPTLQANVQRQHGIRHLTQRMEMDMVKSVTQRGNHIIGVIISLSSTKYMVWR